MRIIRGVIERRTREEVNERIGLERREQGSKTLD